MVSVPVTLIWSLEKRCDSYEFVLDLLEPRRWACKTVMSSACIIYIYMYMTLVKQRIHTFLLIMQCLSWEIPNDCKNNWQLNFERRMWQFTMHALALQIASCFICTWNRQNLIYVTKTCNDLISTSVYLHCTNEISSLVINQFQLN